MSRNEVSVKPSHGTHVVRDFCTDFINRIGLPLVLITGWFGMDVLADDQAVLVGDKVRIEFSAGLPARWLSCEPACDDVGSRRRELLQAGVMGEIRWRSREDEAVLAELLSATYAVVRAGNSLTLSSQQPIGGRPRVHRYTLAAESGRLDAELDLPAGVDLHLTTGPGFIPEALPGFGSIYSRVRPVVVGPEGQTWLLEGDETSRADYSLSPDDWAGIRNRFWTLLIRVDGSGAVVDAGLPAAQQPQLDFALPAAKTIQFYAGPVQWSRLQSVDPFLDEMLFAALWDWLRWLSAGLLMLHGWLMRLVGNAGVAIILLSVCVKILMWPLTRIAEAWQADVNRTQALLHPHLEAIKREFKGEEAHNKILAVYRDHNVHTLYTLKSLAGFLIQIPVFIAAFDMLGENIALHEAAFLWADDLAKPDRLAPLPFVLPFFGGHLNLLPFLMTAFTLLASAWQLDEALTDSLRRSQRLRLYVMAGVFFLLFYTFPAGMVLYWTTNNVLHLLKIGWSRWRETKHRSAA